MRADFQTGDPGPYEAPPDSEIITFWLNVDSAVLLGVMQLFLMCFLCMKSRLNPNSNGEQFVFEEHQSQSPPAARRTVVRYVFVVNVMLHGSLCPTWFMFVKFNGNFTINMRNYSTLPLFNTVVTLLFVGYHLF